MFNYFSIFFLRWSFPLVFFYQGPTNLTIRHISQTVSACGTLIFYCWTLCLLANHGCIVLTNRITNEFSGDCRELLYYLLLAVVLTLPRSGPVSKPIAFPVRKSCGMPSCLSAVNALIENKLVQQWQKNSAVQILRSPLLSNFQNILDIHWCWQSCICAYPLWNAFVNLENDRLPEKCRRHSLRHMVNKLKWRVFWNYKFIGRTVMCF